MSLLLGHGHPAAASYPIGMLLDEAQIVSERLNQFEGQRAMLVWMAISATPTFGVDPKNTKAAIKSFTKTIDTLVGVQP